jgi:hypothetical protein
MTHMGVSKMTHARLAHRLSAVKAIRGTHKSYLRAVDGLSKSIVLGAAFG